MVFLNEFLKKVNFEKKVNSIKILEVSTANSVVPDHTAPYGIVCLGYILFACKEKFVCEKLQQMTSADNIISCG